MHQLVDLNSLPADDPQASTPELDAKEEIRAEFAPVLAKVSELEAQLAAEKAAREADKQLQEFSGSWNKQKAALRKAGWNDEGIEKIEAHAQERGIADLEVAAAHFEKINPPPQIAAPSYGTFDFTSTTDEDNVNFKKLMEAGMDGDPAVERDMVARALADARGGNRR